MMPKEKAFKLYFEFYRDIIAVDEIIKEIYLDQYYSQKRITYYEAVKQEIDKL